MLPLLPVIQALATTAPTTPTINWFPCPQNASSPTITCGTLQVPLDYTSPTSPNNTLTLQLVKINATTQPSQGSIIFDFGGPGNINVDNFAGDNGKALLLGLGITIPFSCYESDLARAAAAAATPQALNASDTAVGAVWAASGALAELCYENAGEVGRLIGTVAVARDIMQIVDALGEDGLLRYYGFSYGTTLGATVAAMFPDRMDKLLFDGVVNPTEYWAGPTYQAILDTDATLSAFFAGCIESPSLCPLAQISDSAIELEHRLASLLQTLKYSPLVLGPNNPDNIVTYAAVKAAIVGAMYFPSTWSSLSYQLFALLTANATAYATAPAPPDPFPPSLFPNLSGPEVQDGIACADRALRSENLTDLLPVLARFEDESWIRGDGDIAIATLHCARWKLTSAERFTGDFEDIRTKNPVLIVGNTIDPATPLAGAKNLSEGFKGSVLLQNDGVGHTTIASPSLCVAKYVRAYFVNGTLPPVGTVCESVTSTQAFAFDGSYLGALESLGNVTKRSVGSYEEEKGDVALFNAVRAVGETFMESKTGLRGR
ncbi:hypothetical protein LTR17_020513 [Elasticomyces elasticus]|nr:hypothetical protein LTR17_020513 [Elasticomyces elasticus]